MQSPLLKEISKGAGRGGSSQRNLERPLQLGAAEGKGRLGTMHTENCLTTPSLNENNALENGKARFPLKMHAILIRKLCVSSAKKERK